MGENNNHRRRTNKKSNSRNRNNNNRGKNPNAKPLTPQTATAAEHANNNGNQNNKKRPGNRNRRAKTLSPTRIIQKYDNLMEQHIVARRKYFEIHGTTTKTAQLQKVEKNYYKTMEDLYRFQDTLKDWQKEVLESKINSLPEDRHYSVTHNLESKGELVPFSGNFEDPHLLNTQVQAKSTYANDTEESAGSMEDYYKYKGITPAPKEDKASH